MTSEDNGEVERLREALEAARKQFSDAVMSVQEGFVVFDAEQRLVICNDTYRQFYVDAAGPEVATLIVPGAHQLDFLAAAFEAGMFPDTKGTTQEYLAWRKERQQELRRAVEIRFSSGVWVQVNERPTQDGGYVAVYTDITELKRRESELEMLSGRLAKYLSPQVYQSIFQGRQEVKVESSRKKLTVFFSDIENFTEITESLESEELTEILNHYLTEMSRIALEYGATIDKFVGDATMMFFGDPETRGAREDAVACIYMAIAMQRRLTQLHGEWLDRGLERPFRTRMGINTGYCTVGNFGSDDRMDYTIIGNEVNLAARIQDRAEPGGILLAHETWALAKDVIACEEGETIKLKGFAKPQRTYRVLLPEPGVTAAPEIFQKTAPGVNLRLDLANLDRAKAVAALEEAMAALPPGKST